MSEVDEKIELHLIDTATLVEEAKKIREAEELARRAKKAKRELAAGVPPLQGPAGQVLPKGFFAGGPQTRVGAIAGARTENEFTKAIRKQKEIERELENVKRAQLKFEEKMIGNFNLAQQILTNPGSIPSVILSKIGKFGIIGSLVAGTIGILYEEIIKQFDRGGVFSTKLKVPAQALTVNDIDVLNESRAGTKYITSELRIMQKTPESSNTANIKFEHIRYTLDNLGRP